MTMEVAVKYLTTIFEAIITVMFASTYAEENGRKRAVYVHVISVFVLAGLIGFSNWLFHLGYFNVVLLTIFNFMVALLFCKRFKTSVMIAVILTTIFAITEVATLFGLTILLDATVMEVTNVEIYSILGTILSKAFAFIIIKGISVKQKANQGFAMKTSYWVLFFSIFATSTLAIYLLYTLQYYSTAPDIYNYLAVGCAVGLLYTMFFSLYLYEKTIEQAVEEQNQEILRQQIKAQAKHVDEILITQKEMKKLRHDLKNHDISLRGYFENQDFEGGLKYLQNMRSITGLSKDVIETGNIALDAILNTKRSIAISKGIIFEAQLQIPENVFIDAIDSCVIFGNALDNCIEACEQVENREKRICITMAYTEGALLCKIVNSANKEKAKFLQTAKMDKANHGFGVKNIEAALSNYKNVHRFSQTEEEFTFFFQIFEN